MPTCRHSRHERLPIEVVHPMNDMLHIWLRRAEVDRAVFYGVLASGWQLMSAPITMLMIARHLTPEVQGFYYTFGSLLALQSFVELGLYVVVLNVASHEWAHLGLDEAGRIVGRPDALSRLVSLGRFVGKWYAVASVLFVVGVGTAGHIFFSQGPNPGVAWGSPWWSLVILSGLLLWTLPLNSLLEGCNQVTTIQKFRLSQLVLRNLALWLTLALGGGLWTAVATAGVGLLSNVYLLGVQYRGFFKSFFSLPTGPRIDWKTEIWPMQSRLALSGTFSYFMFQTFNPVMFHYHGAVVAGQMGMTWSLVSAIGGVASKWLQPKVPRFGMLIARKDYAALDRLWWRTMRASVAVAGAGVGAAWLMIYGLNALNVPLAERLLPPLPTGMFLLGAVFGALAYCQTTYLRAHKQEPLVVLSVVISLLMGLLVWGLGSRFGPLGAATAYLIVGVGIGLPWETIIWFRCRAEWHKP